MNLGLGTDLRHDARQQMERDRGSVELAAAVVRQNNAVKTEVDGKRASATDWMPLTMSLPFQ